MESIKTVKPKLGFSGLGWIGLNRMNALKSSGKYDLIGFYDPDNSVMNTPARNVNGFTTYSSYKNLLESDVDGIVIASPSAIHAEQCMEALKKGKAVFCQKPLGRNKTETEALVKAAQDQDLLLKVDFSYRYTSAITKIKEILNTGAIGKIFGINLVFHNAYGPDKSWYKNPNYSGGGCLMDLGIHLIDLLCWLFDRPVFSNHQTQLFSSGIKNFDSEKVVEDFVTSQFTLNDETAVQLSCSWFLQAGKDAIIEATFYGENGGLSFKNISGSFYDFKAEQFNRTKTKTLVTDNANWQGIAVLKWADELSESNSFNPEAFTYVNTAREIGTLYNSTV